jgi:trk system potassium uptake protein
MRVAIAGAGEVGRSIATDLVAAGHRVLLIERHRGSYQPWLVEAADWMLADACELAALQTAAIDRCDVVIAATGDDKANVVFTLLCKTEFGVPRAVARINHPANRWLFTDTWGVDIAVSTPDTLVSAAEEEVSSGGVVRLVALAHGQASIVELTVPAGSAIVGLPVAAVPLPADTAVLAVLRERRPVEETTGVRLEAGDQLVLVTAARSEAALAAVFDAG